MLYEIWVLIKRASTEKILLGRQLVRCISICFQFGHLVFNFVFGIFSPPLLRYNWHITLCRFMMYNVMIQYVIYWKIFITVHHFMKISYVCMCVVRTFKIYSLSSFQVYNTVLLPIVTMLYMRSTELIHLVTGVCTLWSTSPHIHICPWQSPSHCFYEFGFLRSYI